MNKYLAPLIIFVSIVGLIVFCHIPTTPAGEFYLRARSTGRLIGPLSLEQGNLTPSFDRENYIVANPAEYELRVRECLLQIHLFEYRYVDCELTLLIDDINRMLKKHLGDKAPLVRIGDMDLEPLMTTVFPPDEPAYDVLCDLAVQAQLRIFIEQGAVIFSQKKYEDTSDNYAEGRI